MTRKWPGPRTIIGRNDSSLTHNIQMVNILHEEKAGAL